MRRHFLQGLAACVPALLSACAVGPNFKRPALTPPPALAPPEARLADGFGAQRLTPGGAVKADWWTLFGSSDLNGLVAESLKSNTDLAAAQSALRSAHEAYLAEKSVLLPTASVSLNASRNKSSEYLSPVLNAETFYYRLQTAELDLAYTLDLFGGLRRQIEGARAQEEAQRFQTDGVRLALVSNVVVAAVSEAALARQTAEAEKIVAVETKLLNELRGALRLGQVSRADVLVQETQLAQAEAAIPPLRKQLAVERDLLAYLLGRAPGEGGVAHLDFDAVVLPLDLPATLPSTIIDQRPDIRVAESNLHVASAAVGQAVAARLPVFTLSASAGGSSPTWTTLFSRGYNFWSYGAGVTQPLFQGGALLRRQRAAEAALDQAKSLYKSAVLSAFQNVADVLQALETDAAAIRAAEAQESAAQAALKIAKAQVLEGQAPGISELAAEQILDVAEGALLQARSARLVDTASLFQALGGGWPTRA
jgi:NodT family efflux transporter outer membrane factor (OMF) lipoprotein